MGGGDVKPEDIPQDVWDAAEFVGEAIHGRHVRGWVSWPLITASGPPPQEIVARAIMAERERCAAVADTYFMRWENDGSAYWLERRMHSEEIAGAIRKGTP
jgi:hypothetical protein